MSNINFTCDVCGREVQGYTWVNGMTFCAKCYQETFGNKNMTENLNNMYEAYLKILNEKDQRIAELEEQLKNAVVLEPDHYVIITNGWKNKKYGIALVKQRVRYNYIQETDGRMGSYVTCLEFGKFKTLEEAEQRLKEIKDE